jgi:DNA repair exonuclease SbcCD nuclease subunit
MLRKLEAARIPVIVIEGNHDSHEFTSRFSWLRSFSQWGYIKLLEPEWKDGTPSLVEWDERESRGSYIDIADARIFGSIWFGTTVGQALPLLSEAVRQNRREGATNIMLLHSDIEGQLTRPVQSALSLSKLSLLRGAVDYLALGHTHKKFDIEEWAFNPGSLEACNVDEVDAERGAYLIETDGPRMKIEFVSAGADYFQRPFKRIEYQIASQDEPDQARQDIFEFLREQFAAADTGDDLKKPIIELTLRGQLAFKNSLLRLDKLKEQALEELRPLGLIINNKTIPKQLAVALGLGRDAPRSERELRVIEDIIRPDPRFGHRAREFAELIVEAKRLALEGESMEKILRLIEDRLFQAVSEHEQAALAEGAD